MQPHIVDFIGLNGSGPDDNVTIFMGLKEGSLVSLVEAHTDQSQVFAETMFCSMLQALDCLGVNDIVHRDVKPANILYTRDFENKVHFQLGDFGLCNRAVSAFTTSIGTPLYSAPEVNQPGLQTTKVDVWSLFVTVMWILNTEEFHAKEHQFKSSAEVYDTVAAAAKGSLAQIAWMAAVDPKQRASAAQMLIKHYNGIGLSTPREKISLEPAQASSLQPHVLSKATGTRRSRKNEKEKSQARLNLAGVHAGIMSPMRIEKTRSSARTPRYT